MKPALSSSGYKDAKVNFEFPDLPAINGMIYTKDSLKNKTTFINFWFEACTPCIAEFDALNDLFNKYKDFKDFHFLSFTFETKENALRIAKKYKLEYPIICVEPAKIHKLIFNLGFPTSIITDKKAEITFIICGGPSEKEYAKKRIETTYHTEIERQLFIQ